MNFLAHILLSGENEHIIVGNFLADFISNKEVALLPPAVQAGVELHRSIDFYTDNHRAVKSSIKRLHKQHGKYAPVVLDIFHDFLLIKNWEKYSTVSIEAFTKSTYQILLKRIDLMPDFLQNRLPLMVADDWLVRYGTEDGLNFTFDRVKNRSSAPHYFDNAVETLKVYYHDLNEEFNQFFPDIIDHIEAGIK